VLWSRVCPQTHAFEPESAEAQPYKAALEVAGALMGLLAGSQRVNPKKGGAGAPVCVSSIPQVGLAAAGAWRKVLSAFVSLHFEPRTECARACGSPEFLRRSEQHGCLHARARAALLHGMM
jgi:hypothetical protein